MKPDDDHGDARSITTLLLKGAAEVAGISPQKAAENILETTKEKLARAVEEDWQLTRATVNEAYLESIIRATQEKQYTLGVAWGLDPDKKPAMDGHRVVASPEVLEQAAWNFMRQRRVGLYHQDGTLGHGEVVESYIYRGPDWELPDVAGNKQVIRAGFWLVGNLWDDIAWRLIKRGLIDGLSPQGTARFRQAKVATS